MEDYKLIDYRLYDPLSSFFNGSKKDRAVIRFAHCKSSDSCGLYAKGECTLFNVLGGANCPNGYKDRQVGFTPRAMKYSQWISTQKEKIKGVKELDTPPRKIADIGTHYYFPYPHWYLNKSLPEELQCGFFSQLYYIPKELFTVELINQILSTEPRALMGGIINNYQDEIAPKILLHIKEELKPIYEELIKKYPKYRKLSENISNIGREAYVKTLPIGCAIETRKGNGIWDGTNVIINNFDSAFTPIKGKAKLIVQPDDFETIKITSEEQINSNTMFKE